MLWPKPVGWTGCTRISAAMVLSTEVRETVAVVSVASFYVVVSFDVVDHEFFFQTLFLRVLVIPGTVSNWKTMAAWCQRNQLLFVPSVGPGYNDEGIR